jgi:hypothetical protein
MTMFTQSFTWKPVAEKRDGIATSKPRPPISNATLIALIIRACKPLAQWGMLPLAIFNVDNSHTRFEVISDVSERECVDDTVHLNFGRRSSDRHHRTRAKGRSGTEILA